MINTTDATAPIAMQQARAAYSPLIVVEASYPLEDVGRACRSGLMVALCVRSILSTDADYLPAPSWQVQIETALRRAPVALGRICVTEHERAGFPRQCANRQPLEAEFYDLAMEFERLIHPGDPDGIGLNTAGDANLGFRRAAYIKIGGDRALESGEDPDIVARAAHAGIKPVRAQQAVIIASMRMVGRAPGGMAAQIHARSGPGDCTIDSAMTSFRTKLARPSGRVAQGELMTVSRVRHDLAATAKICGPGTRPVLPQKPQAAYFVEKLALDRRPLG